MAEVIDVTATTGGIKIDNVYVAADVGKIVDPVNFESHVKGGVIWALGHAMNCEITYSDGIADQDNFYAFEGMRMAQCPKIDVRGLEMEYGCAVLENLWCHQPRPRSPLPFSAQQAHDCVRCRSTKSWILFKLPKLWTKDFCILKKAKTPHPVAPPARACLPHRQARASFLNMNRVMQTSFMKDARACYV